jgi:hypothetical protein
MTSVSIVIPTRNRAHLLRYALRSALAQTHEDLEILVCDNDSSDDTARVVKDAQSDPRVRYVNPGKPLSMPDNWEHAMSHASGEHVAFLSDDCYLFPDAVASGLAAMDASGADVAVWAHCAYFFPDWVEVGRRNKVALPRRWRAPRLVASRPLLEQLYAFRGDVSTLIPKTHNSICHRRVVEAVRAKQGRFFLPSCPDFTSAVSVMLERSEHVLIERPLFVDGVTTSSVGAAQSHDVGQAAETFVQEFTQKPDDLFFLGVPISPAGIAASLEAVRRLHADACPSLDVPNVLLAMVDRMVKVESNGADMTRHWRAVDAFLAGQPPRTRAAVARRRRSARAKWAVVKRLRASRFLHSVEAARGVRILDGDREGFHDIEGCARAAARWRSEP